MDWEGQNDEPIVEQAGQDRGVNYQRLVAWPVCVNHARSNTEPNLLPTAHILVDLHGRDPELVPHQATFALSTISRSR